MKRKKSHTWTTAMLAALRMVDRRCATTTVVRPCMLFARASCTRRSLSASRALVACRHQKG